MRRILRTATAFALLATAAMATHCGGDDFEPGAGNKDGGAGTGGSSGASGSSGNAGNDGGSKDPDGTACTGPDPCASGHCVDGVCCDTACDGECEGCATDGAKGTCTLHASGEDPESECPGEPTCTDGKQTDPACDGAGQCASIETSCGDYACGATACKTDCAASTDCATTAWCDGTACTPKKANGEACTAAEECTNDFCEGGYCCASACAAPQSCDSGTCKCNGFPCAAAATCITWYFDGDGDGFGVDDTSTNVLGCSDEPPTISGSASKAGDCDDGDKNAFPGQTQAFGTPKAGGGYDYNCDGVETKKYPGLGTNPSCQVCGAMIAGVCNTCLPGGQIAIGSGYNCKPNCGGPAATQGYKAVIAPNCGVLGTLYTCAESGTACGAKETQSTLLVPQPCN